jgi:hypothetical protein
LLTAFFFKLFRSTLQGFGEVSMEREEEYYDALGVEPMDTSDEERLEEEVRSSFFLKQSPIEPTRLTEPLLILRRR